MSDGDLIWAGVRMLIALLMVVFLAYLVVKYGLARRYTVTSGRNKMKLVEQLPLSPKTFLSLVKLGDKYYVLAHQDNGIQLLKELDELPSQEKAATGEAVELLPRSIKDIVLHTENRYWRKKWPLSGQIRQLKESLSARRGK